jgi:hypothetical protein
LDDPSQIDHDVLINTVILMFEEYGSVNDHTLRHSEGT